MPSHTNEFALLSLLYLVVRSVMRFIVWSLRSKDAQALEVMVLRHQLEEPPRQPRALRAHDRLVLAAASRLISRARWHAFSVRAETLAINSRRFISRCD